MHTEFIVTNITFTIKKNTHVHTYNKLSRARTPGTKKTPQKSGIITILFYYKGVHKK